jgi:hypothetical protein
MGPPQSVASLLGTAAQISTGDLTVIRRNLLMPFPQPLPRSKSLGSCGVVLNVVAGSQACMPAYLPGKFFIEVDQSRAGLLSPLPRTNVPLGACLQTAVQH